MTHCERPSQASWPEVIKQFSEVERLLGDFARGSGLLPEGACRARLPESLAGNLRRLLSPALPHVSLCFEQGPRSWVFTATVCAGLSRERNAPVLWVNAYSHEGTLIEAGAWALERNGAWHRCGQHVDL